MIFIYGIITGLILSLPFGPVGIYCMEKALIKGEKRAYVATLGMVTVDVIYGIITFAFINKIEDVVIKYQTPLKIIISIFLVFVGARKFLKKPKLQEVEETDFNLTQDYLKTFLLAIFNISSLLVIGAILTMLGAIDIPTTHTTVIELALGIALGGAGLWFLTIFTIYHFKKKVTIELLLKLSKCAGLLIMILGALTAIFSFYKL